VTAGPLLVAGLVLGTDRLTKGLVARCLGSGKPVPAVPFLRVHPVLKRFRRSGPIYNCSLLLLWFAALAGILLGWGAGHIFQQPVAQMALGAALAGSGSNLYDRLRCGAVIDFVDAGWWPIFNLADLAITLGVLGALWCI
jgi:signal peptidase II